MKKSADSRASVIAIIEAALWIVASLLARGQLDVAAGRWHILEPWVTLLKFAIVLALIAIAVALHGLLFRWLARRGIVPRERELP